MLLSSPTLDSADLRSLRIEPDGWLHTGDIAYADDTGHFFIVDRRKDTIMTAAYNVYPAEVERVLAAHPAVAMVAVGPVPDATKGELACAYVVRRDGAAVTADREAALKHPGTVPNNYDLSYFSERILPSLGHQDAEVARAIGMPGAYDNGHMRIGWMAHVLTNWAGDTGLLRELDVRIRRPNPFGDGSIRRSVRRS